MNCDFLDFYLFACVEIYSLLHRFSYFISTYTLLYRWRIYITSTIVKVSTLSHYILCSSRIVISFLVDFRFHFFALLQIHFMMESTVPSSLSCFLFFVDCHLCFVLLFHSSVYYLIVPYFILALNFDLYLLSINFNLYLCKRYLFTMVSFLLLLLLLLSLFCWLLSRFSIFFSYPYFLYSFAFRFHFVALLQNRCTMVSRPFLIFLRVSKHNRWLSIVFYPLISSFRPFIFLSFSITFYVIGDNTKDRAKTLGGNRKYVVLCRKCCP